MRLLEILQIRELWTERYGSHLSSQNQDRSYYYTLRGRSRATSERRLVGAAGCAVLIVDGMDQAKLACPRHLPQSKLLQDSMRPRLHVVGVRIAGFLKAGFIVDPTISKDADLWVEVIVRSRPLARCLQDETNSDASEVICNKRQRRRQQEHPYLHMPAFDGFF